MVDGSFKWSTKTTAFDVVCDNIPNKTKGHGKNFVPLVESGKWAISGFTYGSSHCQCCGRPIRRLLHLKNEAHAEATSRDPTYEFPEDITIGVVCGPKVFTESARSFYADADAEWKRQAAAWKSWMDYVVLCVHGREVWELVPEEVKRPIDDYLESGWSVDRTSSTWTLLRDAKKSVLNVPRDHHKIPVEWALRYRLSRLIKVAKRTGILDENVS